MTNDLISVLEYEGMIFGRHVAAFTGTAARTGGTLDQSAFILLTLLQVGGPMSITEISGVTGLDASTLNRQTASLVTKGYAERIPDPTGGIARKFRNTKEGNRVLDEERQASHVAFEKILKNWTTADQEKFASSTPSEATAFDRTDDGAGQVVDRGADPGAGKHRNA